MKKTNGNHLLYEEDAYLNLYDLKALNSIYRSEFLPCASGEVFTQSFIPENKEGIVILIHGYLDHSGSLAPIIHFLVDNSFGVITFDLPGHGYSYGARGDINHFQEYIQVLHDVVLHSKSDFKKEVPFFAIGHSTGCSVLTDYIVKYPSTFQKTILVAPLVKPYLWSFSQLGVKLLGKRVKSIKRKFRKNASNKVYLDFVKKDPLQFSDLPINWLVSLSRWQDTVLQYPIQVEPLYLIQGNKDKTVDWDFNISFLLQKFPNSKAILIDGGNHQLFNEKQSIQLITFEYIKSILLSID
ncbi:alpha/beta fold hydrolase [Sutcliffiella halmapala]|uniref:alpha/beta fold hydrolase n=1 Tax=Sutcliffiella halmapala TaxID=79882 RepID=UPI000995D3C6|nr:alpha/beta hydrolase [Sutcliffiella halmapala]